jgi:succinate-semialdehyde dehydrogenase/glutarate-semialdehyde dehydrogenase
MAACADSVKKITMELGGNAPFIIFDDADLEKAVDAGVRSRFRNAGQTCICANRFLVHEKIYDKFVKLLTAKVKQLEIGRLINNKAVEKVDGLVKNCGGKIICGGKFKGLQYEPTIICDLKPTSKIFAAEIFGPVATVYKFKTEAEVIKIANNTEYGLAAFIFSGDLAKAWRVADELEYGMVGVNEISISTAHSPFGGFKQSGIGREGSHYGIEEYLETKFIILGN